MLRCTGPGECLLRQQKVDSRTPPLRPSHFGCTRDARAPCWRGAAAATPLAAPPAQGALQHTLRGPLPPARYSPLPALATVSAQRPVRRPQHQRRRYRHARRRRRHHQHYASRYHGHRHRHRRAWRARCHGARVPSASRWGDAAARPLPSSPRPHRPRCLGPPHRRPLSRRRPPPPARAPARRQAAAARTLNPVDVGRGAVVAARHRRLGVRG